MTEVAGQAPPQCGEFPVGIAVGAPDGRASAATMSVATDSGIGCVFSLTLRAIRTGFCGAPYGVRPLRSSRMGRSEREITLPSYCRARFGYALLRAGAARGSADRCRDDQCEYCAGMASRWPGCTSAPSS